jgi:MoaA/NifB/PqqE/SkfB family radical SAM enzyme
MNWQRWMTQAKALAGIAHGSRALGGPYEASLWLTNRCNLQCIHCYFYSPLLPEPNYFDVRAARDDKIPTPSREELAARRTLNADSSATAALIDDCVSMGTCSFHFAGSGEPLMHPDALEFMARCKRAGRSCAMNTNGTLLDAQKVDALVRMGFDELRITTMAGTDEVYARTHPGSRPGTFGRVKESLLALAERKAAARTSRPFVNVVFVVVQHNCEGLADFVRMAAEVKADGVIVQPVDDINDPCMAPLVPTEAQAAAVREQVPEMARFLEERGIRHNLGRFSMVFHSRLDTRALYQTIPCYMGWLAVQVHPDGDVHGCCRCYRRLGNVRETPMPVLWHSPAYDEFRRAARQINRRGTPVEGCGCYDCANTGPNLRVFRMLHPGSRRLRALGRQCAAFEGEAE